MHESWFSVTCGYDLEGYISAALEAGVELAFQDPVLSTFTSSSGSTGEEEAGVDRWKRIFEEATLYEPGGSWNGAMGEALEMIQMQISHRGHFEGMKIWAQLLGGTKESRWEAWKWIREDLMINNPRQCPWQRTRSRLGLSREADSDE